MALGRAFLLRVGKQHEAPSTVESQVPLEMETRPGILGPFWSHSETCEVLLRVLGRECDNSNYKHYQVKDAVKRKLVANH